MFALDKTQTQLALATCVLTAFFSVSSHAQSPAVESANVAMPLTLPSSPMSAATAAQIQKINENMTLLQAKLNELELQAKIASKQREIVSQASAQGNTATSVTSSFASKNGNPSVVSVAGLKGSLEAVLVFPGGVTQRVKTGDVIDDRRVSKIAVNEVVLTDLKGKNIQRLAFGNSAMVREATTSVSGNAYGAMPLPPGMPAMLPR